MDKHIAWAQWLERKNIFSVYQKDNAYKFRHWGNTNPLRGGNVFTIGNIKNYIKFSITLVF